MRARDTEEEAEVRVDEKWDGGLHLILINHYQKIINVSS